MPGYAKAYDISGPALIVAKVGQQGRLLPEFGGHLDQGRDKADFMR